MSSKHDGKESPLIDKDYVSINNNPDIHCLDLSIVRTITCTRKLTSKEKELLTDFTIEEDEWRHRGELLAIAIQNEIKMDEARERTIQAAINIEERNRLIKMFDIHRQRAAESILAMKKEYEKHVKKRVPIKKIFRPNIPKGDMII